MVEFNYGYLRKASSVLHFSICVFFFVFDLTFFVIKCTAKINERDEGGFTRMHYTYRYARQVAWK